MAFSMAGRGPSNPQMNVTPLIDVLLVLIIIFMMVVAEQKEKGLEAQIPQPQPEQIQAPLPQRTIVIQVVNDVQSDQPTLAINQQAVAWEDLRSRLEDIFKTRAEKVMFVKADPDLTFNEVAQVIDVAHSAGVDKVGLITAKIEAGQ